MFSISKAGLLAVAVAAMAMPAAAQSGFGAGSFGDGSFGAGGTPAPVPQPPAPGGGDFGGSFGGSFDGGAAPAPQPQPAAPPVGGSDFGGSSFTPGAAPPGPTPPVAGGTQPPPQPQPPVQQQQPPAQQEQPGLQVDPQILAFESRDFGVPPQQQLRQGQFHAPTPTSLPGANVVSTAGLATALNNGMQMVLIDVLGGDYSLPNAFVAPAMATPGSLNDRMQQQTWQWLGQITDGQTDTPIVIYCSDPMCWLSYNGALRAVAAGYSNVYWYRGGIQAWQMAGLPLMPAGY
ncbi:MULTISPECIES: rhodanese-like domain-containing protein [Actibacterium]|uniref:PQQ-dependent catabolism-associated CXXCW motif protein n=1 Tax=Actibacterium naphthalenivorans TaxID=1614693 RepID=A0A840CJW8_9RHOB|nr:MULTISPECIES: rhodanese-like domain-containing protein [Actibacterium]MBB4022377.1 PQQ-dependent catabolism-associated CXXCW motif protein [Actibacterium naphthalenivorans]